jgi:hypothetical protein
LLFSNHHETVYQAVAYCLERKRQRMFFLAFPQNHVDIAISDKELLELLNTDDEDL